MSEDDKVSFGSQCPKGHMPTLVFHREELQKSLKEGTLQLFCNTCGVPWTPGAQEKENIKRLLERNPEILR
jgi:hypothetical protein